MKNQNRSTAPDALISQSVLPVIFFDATILAGQIAASSIAMYRRDFKAYLEFASTIELALLPPTLARWRAHLAKETQKSPNTINRMISAVKRLLREAAVQGYLPFTVANEFDAIAGVKAVTLKERTKAKARVRIEPEQMRETCEKPDLTTLAGIRDNAILSTLAGSGLRVSELVSLKLEQIQKKGRGFVVVVRGKNDLEYRAAPLSLESHQNIQSWLAIRPEASDYIFTAFDGKGDRLTARPLSAVAIWALVRKYSLQSDLQNVKPHDFRRFVGTQLAKKDIRMAQKALGHKRLETTARHYVLDELEAGITDGLY